MERDMGSERATQCKAAREHRLNVRRAAKRRTLEERTARREALVAMGTFSALFTNNDGGPSLGGKIMTAWRFSNSPFGVLKHHD